MEYANSLLNLVWVAVCIAAFTWFLASAGRKKACSRRVLMCRALALGLALVSLFPCVSASDDSVRMALLDAQSAADSPDQSSWSSHHKAADEILAILVSMLEVLESAQVTAVLALTISLCLFALAFALHPASLDRFLPSCPGRAPPCGTSFSL